MASVSVKREVEDNPRFDEERIVPAVGTRVAFLASGSYGEADAEYMLGTVRYVGRAVFSHGDWLGIELDGPFGKNNGLVMGCKYFHCKKDHGLFVRPEAIMAEDEGPAIEFLRQHAWNVEDQLAMLKKRCMLEKLATGQPVIYDEKLGENIPSLFNYDLPRLGASVYVRVSGRRVGGTVRFAGETKFAVGIWLGIALEAGLGKNSGSVQGVSYFKCKPNRGLFVRPEAITLRDDESEDEAIDEGTLVELQEQWELDALTDSELRLEAKRLRIERKALKASLKEMAKKLLDFEATRDSY